MAQAPGPIFPVAHFVRPPMAMTGAAGDDAYRIHVDVPDREVDPSQDRIDSLRPRLHAERTEVGVVVREQDARGKQSRQRCSWIVVRVSVADLDRPPVNLSLRRRQLDNLDVRQPVLIENPRQLCCRHVETLGELGKFPLKLDKSVVFHEQSDRAVLRRGYRGRRGTVLQLVVKPRSHTACVENRNQRPAAEFEPCVDGGAGE